METSASASTGSSTTLNQQEADHSKTQQSISVPSLPLKVYGPMIHTEYLPRVCDDKLSRKFSILILLSFVNLTYLAVFEV